ncbi:hypothetical protein E1B28_004867 [Marasmius oreades]|uniref:EVE domain-containing protein n=1 Tax=Marasmius oreades TaxID=181124 RepID=A0A9P7UZF6_9AGAR|nr:uncharacterized protein E1B28_004867 [Marasmius oreades]KAG7097524.1 hypothetical protein E1B28_004867 [Marasmius oreades]
MSNFWLLKAEPDSRIVKGKDVKFSVDEFESVKTSAWEGVRNYEARNLMKEMKVGEKALFYHSNCKNPGVAAFSEVSKEAYPDYTAWDETHPYYDPKSNKDSPKWFMVDLTFKSRADHFIPLSLLRFISNCSSASDIPEKVAYIGEEGVRAIKSMDLVTRGRLSVQRVDETAWNTIVLMAEKGGWDALELDKKMPSTAVATPKAKSGERSTPKTRAAPARTKRATANTKSPKKKPVEDDEEDESDVYQESEESSEDNYEDDGSDYGKSRSKRRTSLRGTKRKARGGDDDDGDYTGRAPRRKSVRKN